MKEHGEHRMTTFRLKNRTYAQLIVIEDAMALSTRTSALQYAVDQLFKNLHLHTRSMSRAKMDRLLRTTLDKLPRKKDRGA